MPSRAATWLDSALARVPPSSAVPLALLRIGVSTIVLLSFEPGLTLALARGPRELMLPPPGLGNMPALLMALDPWLPLLSWVLKLSACASLLGWFTPLSVALQTLGIALFFGGAQLTGTVIHNLHLLWLSCLLSVAPCGESWSLDAWRKRRSFSPATHSVEATLSATAARVLLGTVYLFPGIEKLKHSGLTWAFSDNLLNQMRLKWFMAGGVVPWPRLDHYPALVQLLAAWAVCFELSFVGLALWRRTRRLAGALGLGFHLGIQHFMYIPFSSLWACYGVLWQPPGHLPRSATHAGRCALIVGVSACLIGGAVTWGLRGETQAWPFACYPSFATRAPATITDLSVEVTASDGRVHLLRRPRERPSHEWGTIWRSLGLYDGRVDHAALRAIAAQWVAATPGARGPAASLPARPGVRVQLFSEVYTTDPDRSAEGPLTRRWVGDAVLP
jgi:Vitamin K-dependent gamma-carboxylase